MGEGVQGMVEVFGIPWLLLVDIRNKGPSLGKGALGWRACGLGAFGLGFRV